MSHNKNSIKTNTGIAIIGIGCLFPKASGCREYWDLLFKGVDAITEVPETHWSAEDYYNKVPKTPDHTYCTRGGFLSPVSYDPTEFGIPPNSLEATDTSQLLGLIAAKSALEDAGYGGDREFDREKTSVILGATGTQELVIPLGARLGHPIWKKALEEAGVSVEKTEDVINRISNAYVSWQENSFPGLLGNVVAGRISNRLNLGGTNSVVDAACASSLSAVNLAVLELLSGRSNMAITGGVDTLNDIFMHMCFAQTGVLSHSGDAKPFSEDADGTVLGEGIGMMVMKRLEDAEKDGDRIYAVLKAVGTSSDGRSQSIYAPNAKGQVKALSNAYELAGIQPSTVELVETHGTGTLVGDEVEFTALKEVFKNTDKRRIAIGAVKSMIGHAKAAAGSAGLIKAALALHNKVLPPTLKAEKPDPKLNIEDSPFYLSGRAKPWVASEDHPRRSGVSSFGFGGSNFHVILEEYEKNKKDVSWDDSIEIIALSSMKKDAVFSEFEDVRKLLAGSSDFSEINRKAAETRQNFSPKDNFRLLIVIEKAEDYSDFLNKASELIDKNRDKTHFEGAGLFYGEGTPQGRMSFMFPGQGSQYPAMGKDLACIFPEAVNSLSTADALFKKESGMAKRLSDFMYPVVMPQDDPKAADDALRSTDVAQPAIGVSSLAFMKILERFGIKPDAACGHSYGELPALHAAGVIDEETFLLLSIARGKFMAAAGNQGGEGADPGSMLAVRASLDDIDKLIKDEKLDVVLANRNSYSQGVLSGSTPAIDHAMNVCKKNKMRGIKLPVAAAFHSRLVSDAAKPFGEFIAKFGFSNAGIPVFSNTTGTPYPEDISETRQILGNQLTNPVNFVENVENLFESGVTTFIEVGPKTTLTGLVKSILKGKDFHALSIDGSSGKNYGLTDLANAISQIASIGYAVNLDRWNPSGGPRPGKQKMSIPISGANYRSPQKAIPPVKKPSAGPTSETVEKTAEAVKRQTRPKAAPENVKPEKVKKETMTSYHIKQDTPSGFSPAPSANRSRNDDAVSNALKVVSEGLKSMQALQSQTADAHKKFLESQTEASRALQSMMDKTREMAHMAIGINTGSTPDFISEKPHEAIPVKMKAETPELVPPVEAPTFQKNFNQKTPEVTVAETVSPPDTQHFVSPEKIKSTLIEVVSSLTGYPEEMLETDMDIESDLGIDSIKRVEILSAFEEKMPGLPPVSPDVMGQTKTLDDIINYINTLLDGHQAESSSSAGQPQKAAAQNEPAAGISGEKIKNALLAVVSELTGYPEEMLEMDMDIESDLGIDSIKRVEILSAFEEKMPGLPPVSPDIMGQMKTLGQITDHLSGISADSEPQDNTSISQAPPHANADSDTIKNSLLSAVSELTGYPVEMLDIEMDLESDLGIDSIKRVEILSAFEEKMPGLPPVSPDEMGKLKTLGQIISYIGGLSSPGQPASHDERPAEKKTAPTPAKNDNRIDRMVVKVVKRERETDETVTIPSKRTVYITDDRTDLSKKIADEFISRGIHAELTENTKNPDRFKDCCGLVIIADLSDNNLNKTAFSLARTASASLLESAENGGAILAVISKMDGRFGFSGKPFKAPTQGGLAGLVKTAAIEWPGVSCHAVDLDPEWTDYAAAAKKIVPELLTRGDIETGFSDGCRFVPEMESEEISSGSAGLSTDDVVLITGGAKGVTAACAKAIAKATGASIILMGRSPSPETEPDWLKPLKTESEIKKAVIANDFAGEKPTPVMVETQYRKYAGNREINETLKEISTSAGSVHYVSADVRNADAVAEILEDIQSKTGEITAVIHGAGVLYDRFIQDKTIEQFETVFDTKVEGIKSVLSALRKNRLKSIVLFSSVAGRMGNKGQVDYAMANEVLNKTAQSEAGLRHDCRVVSINWGPWDGGMVTPSLKKEFEKNNIPLIPVEAGTKAMISELSAAGNAAVEVVIGGLITHEKEKSNQQPPANSDHLSTCFKKEIDTELFPVLKSHIIGGKPVVPFALMAEWFGHSALHGNPGLYLHGIDDMRLLKGIKIENGRKKIRLMAGKAVKNGSEFQVDVEIRNGLSNIHSRAKAVLTSIPANTPVFSDISVIAPGSYHHSIDDIYEKILFHGAELRGIKEIINVTDTGITAKVMAAPTPENWIRSPFRNQWICDPLVLDSAFQMASLWSFEKTGAVSLPSYSASYRQFADRFPSEGAIAIFNVTELAEHKLTGDFTFIDEDKNVLATLKGYEAVIDISLNKAFKPDGITV